MAPVSAISKANLPAILKSASPSCSPLSGGLVLKSAVAPSPINRRQTPHQMAKYMDQLPDMSDCINVDSIDDKEMVKLPDRIMLVNSELPLNLSIYVDNPQNDYLFL